MKQQNDVIEALRSAGILGAIQWAYTSALDRTLADYSEDAGYDVTLLGMMRHTLFRDRLDRVFSCGRYELAEDADPSSGLDVLFAELTDRDRRTMPTLDPGLVHHAPLNGSPGWRFDDLRLMTTSCEYGKIWSLPWSEKSETKQRVARQADWENHPSLFDDSEAADFEWLFPRKGEPLDLDTFVMAHTLEVIGRDSELVVGSPLMNIDGGKAWRWIEELGHTPPSTDRPRFGQSAGPMPTETVRDANVRLKKQSTERRSQDGSK